MYRLRAEVFQVRAQLVSKGERRSRPRLAWRQLDMGFRPKEVPRCEGGSRPVHGGQG